MPEPTPAGQIPDDPVTGQSLSGYYLIASVLLMASLGWALWDEFYGLRPWKSYQQRFHFILYQIAVTSQFFQFAFEPHDLRTSSIQFLP